MEFKVQKKVVIETCIEEEIYTEQDIDSIFPPGEETLFRKVYDQLLSVMEKADKMAVTLHMLGVEKDDIAEVDVMEIIDEYYKVRGEP